MSNRLKIVTVALWLIAVLGMFSVIALKIAARNRNATAEPTITIATTEPTAGAAWVDGSVEVHPRPLGIDVPTFELIDQLRRPISNSDLKGQVWIADFIFTMCPGVCPQMTHKLADMQKTLPAQVKLVSFSVDPDNDTPEKLLAYAKAFDADNDRWHFLTGDKAKVYAAVAGMKVGIVQAKDGNPMEHDSHFMLVDRAGHVCGLYDSSSADDARRLVSDAAELTHNAAELTHGAELTRGATAVGSAAP